MTNTRKDRNWELRDVHGQIVGVKTIQVRLWSTTPDNDNKIKIPFMIVNILQCLNYGSLGTFTLKDRREEGSATGEIVIIVVQRVYEIAISGSCLWRNNSNALRNRWERNLFVHTDHAWSFQLINDLLSLHSNITQSKRWIYIWDIQTQTVNLVKGDFRFDKDFDSLL